MIALLQETMTGAGRFDLLLGGTLFTKVVLAVSVIASLGGWILIIWKWASASPSPSPATSG